VSLSRSLLVTTDAGSALYCVPLILGFAAMRLSEYKVDPEGSLAKLLKACFGGAKRKGVATTNAAMTAECKRQFVETGRRFAHPGRRNRATNGFLGSAEYCARAGQAGRFLRLEYDSMDAPACARACLANEHCNPRHGIPMISPGFHPLSSRFQT